jgi:hypothetical protein
MPRQAKPDVLGAGAAATALACHLFLMTRNAVDFAGLPVRLPRPCEA